MNSSYLNMAAGAFLGTVFVVMSVSIASDALFHTEAPEEEGFAIEVVEPEAGGGAAEEAATPIAVLLASADAEAGADSFRKCASCHTAEEGGANKVGPNLWGVVGRPIASHEGFGYSAAMTEFAQGGEVVWDYEHLAGFLADPRGYISGTAMSFAGLRREDELANVIAYLRTLSADPLPLPEPEAETAAGEAPAEGAAPEGEAPAEGAAPAEGDAPADDEAPAEVDAAEPAAEGEAAPVDAAEEPAAEEPAAAPAAEEPAAGTQEQAPAEAAPAEDAAPVEEPAAPAEEPAANPEQPAATGTEGEDTPGDAGTPSEDNDIIIQENDAAPQQ